MRLTELKYIVAVARQRHFGRAAESCFVSQPTLSVAIKKLEDELGVTLFERNKSDVRVTTIGEGVIEQAQKVLEEADAVKQIAAGGRDQLKGLIRLGAIYTVGPYLFPCLVPNLRERAPDMPLIIQEDFTANLREKLRRGDVDVILVALPFSEPGVETLPVYDEAFEIVMPAYHPLTEKQYIEPHDLAQETVLMLGEGHCFREQVLEVCPACRGGDDDQMQRTIEGGSLETIRHMVASGIGITVLPVTATGKEYYDGDVLTSRPFKPPVPQRTIALAWRKSFPRRKALEVIREAMTNCQIPRVDLLSECTARTA